MSQSLDNFREQKLTEELNLIREQLANATERPQLLERIFANVFIPFFAGEDNPYNASIGLWLNVAGNAYTEVDIIDPNGTVLFTVPPLFDRAAIKPVASDSGLPGLAHVVQSAEQLSRVHPTQGANYLQAEFTKRALVMNTPTNVLAHVNAWNQIFARYGRPPIMTLPADTGASTPEAPAAKDDPDYEFEPL